MNRTTRLLSILSLLSVFSLLAPAAIGQDLDAAARDLRSDSPERRERAFDTLADAGAPGVERLRAEIARGEPSPLGVTVRPETREHPPGSEIEVAVALRSMTGQWVSQYGFSPVAEFHPFADNPLIAGGYYLARGGGMGARWPQTARRWISAATWLDRDQTTIWRSEPVSLERVGRYRLGFGRIGRDEAFSMKTPHGALRLPRPEATGTVVDYFCVPTDGRSMDGLTVEARIVAADSDGVTFRLVVVNEGDATEVNRIVVGKSPAFAVVLDGRDRVVAHGSVHTDQGPGLLHEMPFPGEALTFDRSRLASGSSVSTEVRLAGGLPAGDLRLVAGLYPTTFPGPDPEDRGDAPSICSKPIGFEVR